MCLCTMLACLAASPPAHGMPKRLPCLPRCSLPPQTVGAVGVEEVEAEFWRIVERPEPRCVVEAWRVDDLDATRCVCGGGGGRTR